MPLFLFVSFANRVKRIRDKTFCFDIRLGPNLCTRHTSHIHGARCNSEELHGIRMSEFLPFFLGKWATTGSLSQNLFCQLQVKGEWLIILESLKRKIKVLLRAQTRVLLWAYNDIYLWCPSGALALNFSKLYLSFVSIFTCSGEALVSG